MPLQRGTSPEEIARAIREGVRTDGSALFPVMPYHQYRYMSDEDLASVIVYLRSMRPVRKAQPPSEIPFPVNRFINAVPEPVLQPVHAPDRADPGTQPGQRRGCARRPLRRRGAPR